MTDRKNEPVQLPEPWEDIPLSTDERRKLYAVNTRLHKALAEISERNSIEHSFSVGHLSLDEKVQLSNWKLVRNTVDGMMVAILLKTTWHKPYDDKPVGLGLNFHVCEMFIVSQPITEEISSAGLRDFPLKAIIAAYQSARWSKEITTDRRIMLMRPAEKGVPKRYWDDGDEVAWVPKNILTPLPAECSRRDWFYALVAEQYDAVAEKYPNANAANKMVEINESVAKPSTVRRWIAEARKRGLLLPADWKRGDSDAA